MTQKIFSLLDEHKGLDLARVSDYLVNRYHLESEDMPAWMMSPEATAKLPSVICLKAGYELAAIGQQCAQNPKTVPHAKIEETVLGLVFMSLEQKATHLCLPHSGVAALNAAFVNAATQIKSRLFSEFAIVVANVPHIPLQPSKYYDGARNRQSMFSKDRRDVWNLMYPQSQAAIA